MLIIFIVVLATLITTVVFVYVARDSEEALLVWGPHAGNCTILLTVPGTKQTTISKVSDDGGCKYMIVNAGEKSRLIRILFQPNELVLYRVLSDGRLSVDKAITLGQLEITSEIEWDGKSTFYVSGILNGREQIYRINIETGDITQVTDDPGMAFEPKISPDGSKIAYLSFDGAASRHEVNECFEGCNGYYYVMDTKSHQRLSLQQFADQVGREGGQCEINWSPAGKLVAFRSGCSTDSREQRIVVADIEQNQGVTSIEAPSAILPLLSLTGWYTDTSIVYSATTDVLENRPPIPRYYIFSLEGDKTREFIDFPKLTSFGTPFTFDQMKWSSDKQHVVGVTVGEDNYLELVIVKIETGEAQINYTHLRGYSPVWSPSGEWIAYKAERGLSVIDRNGKLLHVVNDTEDFDAYKLSWFRP